MRVQPRREAKRPRLQLGKSDAGVVADGVDGVSLSDSHSSSSGSDADLADAHGDSDRRSSQQQAGGQGGVEGVGGGEGGGKGDAAGQACGRGESEGTWVVQRHSHGAEEQQHDCPRHASGEAYTAAASTGQRGAPYSSLHALMYGGGFCVGEEQHGEGQVAEAGGRERGEEEQQLWMEQTGGVEREEIRGVVASNEVSGASGGCREMGEEMMGGREGVDAERGSKGGGGAMVDVPTSHSDQSLTLASLEPSSSTPAAPPAPDPHRAAMGPLLPAPLRRKKPRRSTATTSHVSSRHRATSPCRTPWPNRSLFAAHPPLLGRPRRNLCHYRRVVRACHAVRARACMRAGVLACLPSGCNPYPLVAPRVLRILHSCAACPTNHSPLPSRAPASAGAGAEDTGAEAAEIEAAVAVLAEAARSKQVKGEEVFAALRRLETRKVGAEESKAWLAALGGAASPGHMWQLVFTAGSGEVRKAAKGGEGTGSYFPIAAIQRFDATAMEIENGVFLGPVGYLTFQGPMGFTGRRLAFTFHTLTLKLGPLPPFQWGIGKEEDKGRVPGEGKAGSKDPFFTWFYVDDRIAAARGRGGGSAFWVRYTGPYKQ
ncbi:unnamed protein product [Closterium sp. NIES-65]|nr:unnamed protein product [Closterium sp. NIES-65]